MEDKIYSYILGAIDTLGLPKVDFAIEHPHLDNGDYSTNVALVLAQKVGDSPRNVADKIAQALLDEDLADIKKIEVAGLGFINFYLKKIFFLNEIEKIVKEGDDYGKNKTLEGQKYIYEYTDPNPFKQFHIGHLMTNTIGESLSRLGEWNGAEVKRACYQGDVGLHVATAIWGMIQHKEIFPHDTDELTDKIKFLGDAYSYGSKMAKESEEVAEEIKEINKKVFDRSDPELNIYYDKGKEWSLEGFEEEYKRLGTRFDFYFFESETGISGLKVVEKGLAEKIFEKSDGAVIFPGEKYGLHTRVFINSQGLPTYEAKELGLAQKKYDKFPYDQSFVITAKEIDEYFKVLKAAMKQIYPDLEKKTNHISHGMMKLPSGKMSSRTGDVITAREFIADLEEVIAERIDDSKTQEIIAVGAIKYQILKQAPGKDIIYDRERWASFEGDSGPYLQYTYVRTKSILEKADKEGIKTEMSSDENKDSFEMNNLGRMLYQFPEIVLRAEMENAPQHVVNYITEVASAFNSFYAQQQIVDEKDPHSPIKLMMTKATQVVIKNGLEVLGIKVPERM